MALKFNPLTGQFDLVSDPASTTLQGVVKLAGDLAGSGTTADAPIIKTNVALAGNPTTTTQATTDNSTKLATTAYVTTGIANAVAGVNPAIAVQAATTSAANTSGYTYNNGVSGVGATFTGVVNTALTVDGYTFTAVGQRLLVKNDTQSPSGAFNGIYYVTQVQSGILPVILTRALDYNTPSDINNTGAIPVVNGTVNALTSWLLTSAVTTVGTDPLTYTQFSINPTTVLTNALTSAHLLVGNSSNVATDVAVTGDVTITNAGVTAVGAGKITNAMVNAAAAIVYSKLSLAASILSSDLAFQPQLFAYQASGYYAPEGTASAGTQVLNTALWNRMWLPAKTVDRLGIEVTAAAVATGTARVGLYASDASTGLPSGLALIDSGALATTSIAYVEATVSYAIPTAGWFWLCTVCQTTITNLQIRRIANITVAGIPLATSTTLNNVGFTTSSFATGALPTATGATFTPAAAVGRPLVRLT